MRRVLYFLILILWVATVSAARAEGSRIKDIAIVAGARDNQLAGYGLVVGLAGDGDKNPIDTLQTIGNLLQQGLGQGRSMPAVPAPAAQAPAGIPALPAAPQASDSSIPPPSQDSQPMKDVLKQLFNR